MKLTEKQRKSLKESVSCIRIMSVRNHTVLKERGEPNSKDNSTDALLGMIAHNVNYINLTLIETIEVLLKEK